ncbi:hypothetical protein [Candidatus Nitrosocosmicus franklandus]|uniref:Uncharacterized protein n=1 Tax=Candidatus Nitrosocosmicus franklandianus TaxID=1798806 RepID=A0A484IFT3_9ARCH|nr:hypothetical protein [Candidatus Nitrosocosmicus franklandus]VFJ13834.1 protein of unknown function [Candidatus Nitrosocosmicus franklandus]
MNITQDNVNSIEWKEDVKYYLSPYKTIEIQDICASLSTQSSKRKDSRIIALSRSENF